MATTMVSPLVLPLGQLLGDDVRIWSYEDDFDALWALLSSSGREISWKHQVILWTRTPRGNCFPVDTVPFVSPLVWALCAANRFGGAQVRVTVVDLSPAPNGSAELRHQIESFKDEATRWLRILTWRDLVADAVGSLKALFLGGAGHQIASSDERDARPFLLDALRLRLTDPQHPDKRHAVANVLGPLLLLGRRPRSLGEATAHGGETDHLAALEQIASNCGLIATSAQLNSLERSPRQRTRLPGKTRVILVDDQWHQGWAEWVCDQLDVPYASPTRRAAELQPVGANGRVEVLVAHDPSIIVDALTSALSLAAPGSDRRLQLSISGRQDANEVLLLDLRLFAGHEDLELAFYRRVLPLCRRFAGPDHAWLGFSDDELFDIERLCATEPGITASDSTLTIARALLPRLIALVDCSFPIVLFSSTGERTLIDKMMPYRNIVASFAKPRLHSVPYGSYWDEEVSRMFHGALDRVASFLRMRNLLAPSVGRPCAVLTEPKFATIDVPHVSIYIDESGSVEDGELSLTGIVALYPDHAHEGYFRDVLEQNRVKWGPKALPKRRPSGVSIGEFEAQQAEVAQIVLDEASGHNVALCVVNLKASPQEWVSSQGDVSDPYLADNLHRWMTRALVELALFRALPLKLSGTEDTRFSVSVFTDLRSAAWPTSRDAQERETRFGYRVDHSTTPKGRTLLAADALDESLDEADLGAMWLDLRNQLSLLRNSIRSASGDNRFTRVPPYGVIAVLQDVMEAYRDHPICRAIASIKEARAFALTRANGGASRAHPLHSWVDWISNAMSRPAPARPSWVGAFRARSMPVLDLRFRPSLRAVLAIERLLDVAVDRAAGLRRLLDERRSVAKEEEPDGLLSHETVDNAIARAAARMTGNEFVEAALSAIADPSTSITWRVSNFDAALAENDAVGEVRKALEAFSSAEIYSLRSQLSRKGKPVVEASFKASETDLTVLEASMKGRWIVETVM